VQKLDCIYGDVERRHLKSERPWTRKVSDQLTESSNDAQYFLNPGQNMAATAMMLWSILELNEPEARAMY
jgi:hypothetical protein